jgi:hypothetical protein
MIEYNDNMEKFLNSLLVNDLEAEGYLTNISNTNFTITNKIGEKFVIPASYNFLSKANKLIGKYVFYSMSFGLLQQYIDPDNIEERLQSLKNAREHYKNKKNGWSDVEDPVKFIRQMRGYDE